MTGVWLVPYLVAFECCGLSSLERHRVILRLGPRRACLSPPSRLYCPTVQTCHLYRLMGQGVRDADWER